METKIEINTECCPEFQPENWEDKSFEWKNKKFIRDKVFTFMHVPIGFGRTMKRIFNKMEKSGAQSKDWMCLSDHSSAWNMDIYVDVDREVSGAKNIELDGNFYSKVYEGSYNKTREWCNDFEANTKSKGIDINKQYMWYAYCPNCAKKFGNNYVAIIGEINKKEN